VKTAKRKNGVAESGYDSFLSNTRDLVGAIHELPLLNLGCISYINSATPKKFMRVEYRSRSTSTAIIAASGFRAIAF
jgi:hypothetical protein